MEAPTSFEQCNQILLHRQSMIDLQEYIDRTRNITFITPTEYDPRLLVKLAKYMLTIASLGEYPIALEAIEEFGFTVKNTLRNKIRLLRGNPIQRVDNEISFMRKNKLKPGIDYKEMPDRIEDFNLPVRYNISVMAFHKLIGAKYGKIFLAVLSSRIFQITSHYHQYLDRIYDERIKLLQKTVHGLTDDLANIANTQSSMVKNMIMNDMQLESYEYCGCLRDSYISNEDEFIGIYEDESICSQYMLGTPPSPNSPIDTMLELPGISSNLERTHDKLQHFASSPDTSTSEIYGMDTIPMSPIKGSIFGNHVDILRRRFSTCLQSIPNKDIIRSSIA